MKSKFRKGEIVKHIEEWLVIEFTAGLRRAVYRRGDQVYALNNAGANDGIHLVRFECSQRAGDALCNTGKIPDELLAEVEAKDVFFMPRELIVELMPL